jgi:hypothetical protein
MRFLVLAGCSWLVASTAFASDKGDCRKARRHPSIDGWTTYVLEHPQGVCEDEALGQMIVLGIGRVASGMMGDPTKLALAMAQLGHMSDSDFQAFRDLMGGLGGLGGLGGGLGGLGGGLGGLGGGLGGLGGLGGDAGGGEDYSSLFGGLGEGYSEGGLGTLGMGGGGDDTVYVGFNVVSTEGGWNADAFYTAFDGARFGLQDCWKAKSLPLVSMNYDVQFQLAAGKPSVKQVTLVYSSDSAAHPDAEACVRSELDKAVFPAEFTGTYTYRVEFY